MRLGLDRPVVQRRDRYEWRPRERSWRHSTGQQVQQHRGQAAHARHQQADRQRVRAEDVEHRREHIEDARRVVRREVAIRQLACLDALAEVEKVTLVDDVGPEPPITATPR
jgi:hypothetical protein